MLTIGGQRYTLIVYSSGIFVLTNLLFLNRLDEIYSYFVSFCFRILRTGVGCLNNISKTKTTSAIFTINFLIENCQFSFQVLPELFQRKFQTLQQQQQQNFQNDDNNKRQQHTNSFIAATPPKMALVHLTDYFRRNYPVPENLYEIFGQELNTLNVPGFPADHLRVGIRRSFSNAQSLLHVKSAASLKRNKDKFNFQKISILLFRCGKITITGMQTIEDRDAIFHIMKLIVDFFYSDPTTL